MERQDGTKRMIVTNIRSSVAIHWTQEEEKLRLHETHI